MMGDVAAAESFLGSGRRSPPPTPNSVFVPQLPSLHAAFSRASQLMHLKVGLLNVAWQPAAATAGETAAPGNSPLHHQQRPSSFQPPQPPMTQPLTLPLMLHLHPTLLTPTHVDVGVGAPSGSSSFLPATLRHLQSSLLPSLLRHLPSMIGQIKVKKLDTLRGNRVGLVRDANFVGTFTFKETRPAYHVLTVASKRIRRTRTEEEDQEAEAEEAGRERQNTSASTAAAAAATPISGAASGRVTVTRAPVATAGSQRKKQRPGYSLSSHLTNFDLFVSPHTRIQLLPIRRSNGERTAAGGGGALAPDADADAAEGDGFYLGEGYASYLVSKHTLHVRVMPKKQAIERMAEERRAEAKRRERMEAAMHDRGQKAGAIAATAATAGVASASDAMELDADDAAMVDDEDEEKAVAVGVDKKKRKQRASDTTDSTSSSAKRRSVESSTTTPKHRASNAAAALTAPIIPEDDFDLSAASPEEAATAAAASGAHVEMAPSEDALREQEGDDAADWLNYQV